MKRREREHGQGFRSLARGVREERLTSNVDRKLRSRSAVRRVRVQARMKQPLSGLTEGGDLQIVTGSIYQSSGTDGWILAQILEI